MQDLKLYSVTQESQQDVSEPIVAYSNANILNTPRACGAKNVFHEEWERAMTIEEFRAECKQKLSEMYANV